MRTLADSPELVVTISSESAIDIQKLPHEVIPKGLDLKRQWYLYEELSPFCSSPETASITCPRPTQLKSSSTSVSDLPSDSMASAPTTEQCHTIVKRKRTCSHCHQEGHIYKNKRGKITCPQLL